MLYELRTYTVKPGSLGDMVKAASTLAWDILVGVKLETHHPVVEPVSTRAGNGNF